ncbi:MAG TPA: hypothetical protein VFH88_03005 [Candidatus Krumholzibacteria bacterium]|nr:hypothetical protein [Candidatus Krumholzibacteria bacterium]
MTRTRDRKPTGNHPRNEVGTHRRAAVGAIGPKLSVVGGVAFLLVVLKNAWASDDSYIIFRSLEQLFAGNGPVWNAHERVQVFTSPLWFWLLSIPRTVSHDVYLNALVFSVALVAVMLVFMRRALRGNASFLMAVLLLVCCNGFVDFTTSGLENSLAYALIAFYLSAYVRVFEDDAGAGKSLTHLALAFGLAIVTRHDLSVLLLPSFAYALYIWRRHLGGARWVRLLLIACGPMAVWSLFALVYYGSIFPNSALAKLDTGIAWMDLVRQGGRYLVASVRYDTIAAVAMVAALVAALRSGKGWAIALAFGVLADVAYVVSVGGDFMLGRFLSFAYLVCVLLLGLCVNVRGRPGPAFAAVLVLGGYALIYPHTPVNSGRNYVNQRRYAGIADERGVFFEYSSIYKYIKHAAAAPGARLPYFPANASSKRGYDIGQGPYKLTDSPMIGFFGYSAGIRLMIVDRLGLADPLLARLPVADPRTWRIGHFQRAPVPGYYESIASGTPQIHDPQLNEFYRKVRVITRGRLFSRERLQTIVAMNLGRYDHYLASVRP